MFDAVIARFAGFNWPVSRQTAVVIPLDRPDLMADAGYEGLRYQGPAPRGRHGGGWLAPYWIPIHAVAG